MHGLLMSLRRAGLWQWSGEREKTLTQRVHGAFLGMERGGHPAGPAETLLLPQNANDWSEVSGLTPHFPHRPLLYSVKYRASVKSILGGAIVFQEATVKLEWWRPGQARGPLLSGGTVQSSWIAADQTGDVSDESPILLEVVCLFIPLGPHEAGP